MIEPHADLRHMAGVHAQMFQAWRDAGFDDDQALALLLAVVSRFGQP